MSDDDGSMWIRTEPTLDGKAYVVTLSLGEDFAVTLTPARARHYAEALLAAVADAEYDHAVFRQLAEKLGLSVEATMGTVLDLRAERPPREASGLVFTGGVAHRNKLPFIAITNRDGDQLGQLSPARARGHALHVLEAVPVADLDATYLRVLRGIVGVDEATGRAVVDDLANWRLDPLIESDV